MVKRKCGTCRYFKDGGIAGSGWCNHPARRELHHMVLVRKTEIACRNNWDQDLWEPAPGLGGEPDDAGAHIPEPPGAAPIQPAAQLVAPPAIVAGDMFTDKLTSITMAAPRTSVPTTDDQSTDDATGPVDRSEVRAARRRRVEQFERDREHLQRQRSDDARRLLESAPDAADSGVQRASTPEVPVRSAQAQHVERRPVTFVEQPRPARPVAPTQVTHQDTRASAPPIATHQGKRVSTPPMPPTRPPVGGNARESSISFGASPSSFQSNHRPTKTDVSRQPVARTAPAPRHIAQDTDELPIAEVRSHIRSEPPRPLTPPSTPAPLPERANGRALDAQAQDPPIDERDPGWMVWAGQIDGGRSRDVRVNEPPARQESSHERLPTAMPADPIDGERRSLDVPRCCATCRDFRPMGAGTSGWCANPYAFPNKRMVESSDLACRSSIGSWWLPTDEIWMDRADTTHHSRPTPLLDEFGKTDFERERETSHHPE